MKMLRQSKSFFRKAILLGWSLAVLWIYVGNLVNFHQHHIWGKQLIPVACYSTRSKEKDSSLANDQGENKTTFVISQHFDFAIVGEQISDLYNPEIKTLYFDHTDTPLPQWGILAYSLRGPPQV